MRIEEERAGFRLGLEVIELLAFGDRTDYIGDCPPKERSPDDSQFDEIGMLQDSTGFHLALGGRETEAPAGEEQANGLGGLIEMGFQVGEHGQKFLSRELPLQVEMEQPIRVNVDLVNAHAENINDKREIINRKRLSIVLPGNDWEQQAEAGLKRCGIGEG